MKKLFVLAATAIAIQTAPVAAMERPVMKQSPMVLVELQANMKADLILAERKMGWEIQDELQALYKVVFKEQLISSMSNVAELKTDIAIDWNTQSED